MSTSNDEPDFKPVENATPEPTNTEKPSTDEDKDTPADDAKSAETTEEPASNDVSDDNEDYDQDDISLDESQVGDLLSGLSGGKITSIKDLNALVEKAQQAESTPKFTNPQQQKVFEFLSKYPGSDFSQGLSDFAKLQSLDISSMDNKSALKELQIMESMKKGLSKEKAEALFEHNFAKKYESEGDIGEILLESDAADAKAKLQELQKDALLPAVDTNVKSEDKAYEQERATFLSEVEKNFNNEQGQFKELKLSFSDNKDEDLTFEISDPKSVRSGVEDFGNFFQSRYISDKGYDIDRLKIDVAVLSNLENILQTVFEHGANAGKERGIRERTNTPITREAPSNAPQGKQKTLADAILGGSITHTN
jgi:hypothetical protein